MTDIRPWPSLEWDDGYPTDESLDAVREFLKDAPPDWRKSAEFIRRELEQCAANCCASYRGEWQDDPWAKGRRQFRIEFSTGGWSGAEAVVCMVMKPSRFDLGLHWFSSQRGGHYVFLIGDQFMKEE